MEIKKGSHSHPNSWMIMRAFLCATVCATRLCIKYNLLCRILRQIPKTTHFTQFIVYYKQLFVSQNYIHYTAEYPYK